MERLTCNKLKTICDGYFVNLASKKETTKYRMLAETAPKYEELYRKLAEYEDLEEQGLLLKLPCKVGDAVWWLNGKFLMECEIESFVVNEDGVSFAHIRYLQDKKHNIYYGHNLDIEKLGIIWFLTKEEAKQALAEMKGV